MTEPDKNSKIIEVSGPNVIKESEPKNIEEIEKNDLPDNLNDLQILPENDKNENNPLNIINMEQKEKSYKDEITQKNEFEENKIPNNINEEKEQNIELTSNNNLSKILNTNNIDIANLVKSQSYLTSLPITNNRNKKQIQLTSANRKTYNYLKEKENSLCLEINAIKQKRSQLNSYSFEKLGGKNIIENNIRETELKKLKQKENNLLGKLENIKVQISDLINNEKKLNRKNNIKEFLEKLNNNETTKNIIKKTKSIEAESNIYRQKHMLDLEKAKNKKINEINKKEEELMNNRIQNLRAQRQREIELMRKRKKQIDEKIEKTKKYIQNKPIFDPENYLYNKLANQFEENEKKLLYQQKMDRKTKMSGIEEINIVKRRIIESKYELEKRRIEKTNEMHQLWHSRSLIMPKYQSKTLQKLNEYEAKQAEDEEKEKIKKVILVKEKEKYGENVPLPPISEKLKGEREKRQITFLNYEGKERVKCIKDELSNNKCKNKNYIIEEQIFKQNSKLQKYRQRISKSQEKERNKNKLIKSESCENIKVKNILGKPLSPKKLRMKKPKEINYLEEFRKERKNEIKNNNINWNKELQNSNTDMIQKKIEVIEEQYQREKDLMKAKGGYLNNQDLGNDLNNKIINSIRGKLALLENMNS
jgi:hypothetical protein